MKIKLNRELWNHKAGEEMEIGEDRGSWAISNGHASEVIEPVDTVKIADTPAQNKAIEPKYKRNKLK